MTHRTSPVLAALLAAVLAAAMFIAAMVAPAHALGAVHQSVEATAAPCRGSDAPTGRHETPRHATAPTDEEAQAQLVCIGACCTICLAIGLVVDDGDRGADAFAAEPGPEADIGTIEPETVDPPPRIRV